MISGGPRSRAHRGETATGPVRISRGREGVPRSSKALAGDCAMSAPEWDRRAAIAACGALALVTMMRGGGALAQSRPAVGAIRVDVAPLRASAGDPTATWVEQELPRQLAQALSGRLTPKGATLNRADRLAHDRAEQGQPGLGQHQRRRDGRGCRAARAGDIAILGFGDRCGDDRAIQSCPCFGGDADAGVLDCARSLIRPAGFGSFRRRQPTPPLAPAPTGAPRAAGSASSFGVRALALAFLDPESQCDAGRDRYR